MQDIHSHNYPATEAGHISCSLVEGASNNSSRYPQVTTFNSEYQDQNSRKMNSRKNEKLFCSDKTGLLTDTDSAPSTVGIDLNIPLKRHLQLVIMGNSLGASLSQEGMLDIQQLLINEISDIAYREHGPELKFYSSTLLKTGWIMLNCHDESTFQWVFDWSATSGKTFAVVKASAAPWRPARICLTIFEMTIDVNAVIKLLISQNSNLQLDTWKYIGTHMMNGYWYLHFLVPGDGVWRLEDSCWKVHFILEMLSVSVVEIQSCGISMK